MKLAKVSVTGFWAVGGRWLARCAAGVKVFVMAGVEGRSRV